MHFLFIQMVLFSLRNDISRDYTVNDANKKLFIFRMKDGI